MVCQKLVQEGSCPDGEDCPFSHFLELCELCSVTLVTPFMFEAHLRGKTHSKRVYHATGASRGACTVCNAAYGPPTVQNFVLHCRTDAHKLNAERARANFRSERVEVTNVPENSRLCTTCNKAVPNNVWARHLGTRKHLSAIRFHSTKSVFESAGQNKHSVEISGDEERGFDFGVVSPDGGQQTLSVNIDLTSHGSIQLVEVRLSTQTGSRRFTAPSPFTLPTFRGALSLNHTRSLALRFNPVNLGRFEDRIEFVFRDTTLSQQFAIARPVRAVVANQGELDALGPIAPFVRPPRRRFAARDDDIEGVRFPFPSDIQWVAKMAKFDVPDKIKNALSTGNPEAQLNTVRSTLLPPSVTPTTYSRHWSTLIYIEEVRMIEDLSKYDMEAVGLEQNGPWYSLHVPGLAEKRPSVILGDKIRVRVHGREGKWYAGYVHKVEMVTVQLRFHHGFTAVRGQLFDVRFTLGRTPLRRMHQALAVAWNPERILFPDETHITEGAAPTEDDLAEVSLYNRRLENNPQQKLAVASVLCQPPGSVPFVIFGPPGTGKTVVAVEAMRQILARDPQARILACAPSNSAADLLAERLAQAGITKWELLRLNAATRPLEALSKTLIDYSRKGDGGFLIPPLDELLRFRVIVTTCISSSLPYALGMPRGHFGWIFIDEAGQALETEAMISIRTMAGTKTNIVLSGDPKQLGPIVRSDIAIRCGLGVSYLDRLMSRPIYDVDQGRGVTIVKLVQNYRSHGSILDYPNRTFYRGELQARADPAIINSLTRFDQLVTPGFPIIFHAISGEDMREASSPSFFNPHEVLVVKKYVQALRTDQRLRLQDSEIGVISPYNAQNGKIRKEINSAALKKNRPGVLKVGSVEEFQGQERRVIIVSTVRSNTQFVQYDLQHTLGFVANPRRFNVAMTRAQALLIIVGDPVVLSLDRMWRDFLDYIHASGGWKGRPRDWDDDASAEAHDFLAARRDDARNAMDELAQRLQNIVIDEVADSESESVRNEDEGGQDRPWAERDG